MSLKWVNELVNIKTVNLDYLVENIINEVIIEFIKNINISY